MKSFIISHFSYCGLIRMVLLSEKRLTKKINASHDRVLRITCLKIFLLEKDNSVSIGHKILRALN